MARRWSAKLAVAILLQVFLPKALARHAHAQPPGTAAASRWP